MKVKIGSWITLNNAAIAEIMVDVGFDWLWIDIEHSIIDFYEAKKAVPSFKYLIMVKRGVVLSRDQGYGFSFEHYKNNFRL